jgi:Macro domain
MGKGLALQFKQVYPGNFGAYQAACRRGEVRLGTMFVHETDDLDQPRYLINFPTINQALGDLPDVRVLVYPPQDRLLPGNDA